MAENSVKDLMNYLSTEEKPVKTEEFMAFWKSLTEEEKAEFKAAELPS